MDILTWMVFSLTFHINLSYSRRIDNFSPNNASCKKKFQDGISDLCRGNSIKRAVELGPQVLKSYMDWDELYKERMRSRGDTQPFQNLIRTELANLREGKTPQFEADKEGLITKEILDFLLPEIEPSEFLRSIPRVKPHNWALEIFGVDLPDVDYFFFSKPKEWRRREIDPRGAPLAVNYLRNQLYSETKKRLIIDAAMQCCSKCDHQKMIQLDKEYDFCT